MMGHDKKRFFSLTSWLRVAALFSLFTLLTGTAALAQMGVRGTCPMCGQTWDGRYTREMAIPDNLPRPEADWLNRLQDVLAREKLSKLQYEKDSRQFNLQMPYVRVIPDERNHIAWLERLLSAYGASATAAAPEVKKADSAQAAYEIARALEAELVPDYEWLIQNTSDAPSRQVIETILWQTRMHYTMFDHALSMGWMMRHRGHGMGRGMMGY